MSGEESERPGPSDSRHQLHLQIGVRRQREASAASDRRKYCSPCGRSQRAYSSHWSSRRTGTHLHVDGQLRVDRAAVLLPGRKPVRILEGTELIGLRAADLLQFEIVVPSVMALALPLPMFCTVHDTSE